MVLTMDTCYVKDCFHWLHCNAYEIFGRTKTGWLLTGRGRPLTGEPKRCLAGQLELKMQGRVQILRMAPRKEKRKPV